MADSENKSPNLPLFLSAGAVLAIVAGVLLWRPKTDPVPPSPVARVSPPPGPTGAPPPSPAPAAAALTPNAPVKPDASAAQARDARSGPVQRGTKAPAQGAPGGRLGTSGAPPALSAQAMLRRSFAPGQTSSESTRGVDPSMRGFDMKGSGGVDVKRAPDTTAFVQFSTTPVRVKPGDKYNVRIALVNAGKNAIDIKDVSITTTMNGKATTDKVKPLVKQVASRQNEVVHELSGEWDKGTATWRIEVTVTSNRQDVYRNELIWK